MGSRPIPRLDQTRSLQMAPLDPLLFESNFYKIDNFTNSCSVDSSEGGRAGDSSIGAWISGDSSIEAGISE